MTYISSQKNANLLNNNSITLDILFLQTKFK